MTIRHIPEEIRSEIDNRLRAIEHDFGVRVLLAVESGSRAWGFASPDSDYDVRFVYIRPPAWYLAVDLEEKRAVIETPIEGVWDINGWDLRKALKLYRKSNPPLLEWLQSPIVYMEQYFTARRLRELLPSSYSPTACMHHYLHVAQRNYRDYLQGEEIRTKKYFYVLRPILACRWLERGLGAIPMEFERLMAGTELPDDLSVAIGRLLDRKRAGEEVRKGPRVPVINRFLESELDRFERSSTTGKKPYADIGELNRIFRESLDEVWRGMERRSR